MRTLFVLIVAFYFSGCKKSTTDNSNMQLTPTTAESPAVDDQKPKAPYDTPIKIGSRTSCNTSVCTGSRSYSDIAWDSIKKQAGCKGVKDYIILKAGNPATCCQFLVCEGLTGSDNLAAIPCPPECAGGTDH